MGPGERRLSREKLVEHAGKAVLVGPGIDGFTLGLLGTHVEGSPHAQSRTGQTSVGGGVRGPRDTEVRHQGVALGEQDVLGLHVAMNQVATVGVVERFAGLPHQADSLGDGERALAGEPLAQGLALHVRHDVERPGRRFAGGAGVEQREDMGVLKRGQNLDLAQEALGGFAGDGVGSQNLDGDGPVVLLITREIDDRHATVAQLPLDGVAIACFDWLQDGGFAAAEHAES